MQIKPDEERISMLVSDYLKSKMEADKVLATQLDRVSNKIKENTISLTSDIYNGIERASWYTSCMFEKYNDVCQELKLEDRRMFFSIVQVYRREDVILDIVHAYTKILIENLDEQKKEAIAKLVLGTASEISTNRAIKESLAYLIAKSIASSFSFSSIVIQRINKYSAFGITMAAFYGKVQEAAMSARHLRDVNPQLYWVLYSMQIEMLYFLVEPILPAHITINKNDESEIINFINGMIKL
ncbi:hypothetical protein [Lonsdalea quercina]|uniref:hypothetical protein n=2 Tax=Lonsdalea quercina TaxID=71657 RepID=UPI00397493F8